MNLDDFRDRFGSRATLARLSLTEEQLQQLEQYYALLARWNQVVNLTALPLDAVSDRAVDRLLIEPLLAAKYVDRSPLDWIDVGSGGGSPAIPIKIVRPAASLTMIEATSRKAAFLRETVRQLALPKATVVNSRIEMLAQSLAGMADLLTARAIRIDRRMLTLFHELLRSRGRLLVFEKASTAGLATGLPFWHLERADLLPTPSRLLILTRQ